MSRRSLARQYKLRSESRKGRSVDCGGILEGGLGFCSPGLPLGFGRRCLCVGTRRPGRCGLQGNVRGGSNSPGMILGCIWQTSRDLGRAVLHLLRVPRLSLRYKDPSNLPPEELGRSA
jgi:hypothetical protein